MIFLIDQAQGSLFTSRISVTARLSELKDIFNVILYNAVGLIWLAQEWSSIPLHLGYSVRNLVPEYWRQVVKTNLTAPYANICMKRHYKMSTRAASREADVADYDAQSSARYQQVVTPLPNAIELIMKPLIVHDMAKLALPRGTVVFLQRPIGR